MLVKEIMSRPVVVVDLDTCMENVARTLLAEKIGCVVVVDRRGKAAGIVTERDFTPRLPGNPFDPDRSPRVFGKSILRNDLAALYQESRAMPASAAMRLLPANLRPNDQVERAIDLMLRHDVLHLVVLEKDKPVGVVSRHDLLKLVAHTSKPREIVYAFAASTSAVHRRAISLPSPLPAEDLAINRRRLRRRR